MSKLGHKLGKWAKNNFSPKSWLKGKGIIGFYNPIMKVRRDAKKLYNGFERGTYKRYLGANSAQGVYNVSGTSTPSRISELM